MIYRLYRGLTSLGWPLIAAYLHRRRRRGKEDKARFKERLGRAGLPRPPGRLIWLHAASVGESVSMLPVVERLQALPDTTVLVTTGTVTSATMMARRLPAGALHQYVPVDRLAWVRRFLDHWRPDLALWCESEFWPNMMVETAGRGVPLILLNGRVSEKSFARWRQHPRLIRRLLGCFSLCLGQTPEDVHRLMVLGAQRVACRGNLKFAVPPLPADPLAVAEVAAALGSRPRWLAASTHAGEEVLAGRVHKTLAPEQPGLLTIIIPRHPIRGVTIAAELRGIGLDVAQRSAGEPVTAATDILLADTLGEMGLFYRLSPIVWVGKSLVGAGGQNPLEPARLGASVLFGPKMDNFAEIAEQMVEAGAAETVPEEGALARAIARRLIDPGLVEQSGAKARNFATDAAGVLDAVLAELDPWLDGKRATP